MDWADEIAAKIGSADGRSFYADTLGKIAAALRKAREDALEEAAKEAERDIDENGAVWIRPYHEIADAIRSLKRPENEKAPAQGRGS